MRAPWISMLVSSVCIASISAQSPPTYQANQNARGSGAVGAQANPAQPQTQPTVLSPDQQKRIDEILTTWETDGKALESLLVRFKVSKEDAVFKKQTFSVGEARVLKMPVGTFGIRLEIYEQGRDGKPDYNKLERKYIFSGIWLYEYDPSNKIIYSKTVQQAVKPDDGPFAFIFGLKALEAKKRFALSIEKADKDWTWLKINPLTPQDQKEFTVAILGMVNYVNRVGPKDFPIYIKWKEVNNNTMQWEITETIRNDKTKVSPLDFTIDEDKKAGWKVQLVPAPNTSLQSQRQPSTIVPAGGYTPKK